MWPGQQQPPGGEQNPQDAQNNPYQQQPGQPNPYQQPGYGEQQPGYGYPQPDYQQPPPVQPWGQTPSHPGQPPQPPQGGGGSSPFATKTVAIVAASAVVVAAAVTGAFVLTRDDNKKDVADPKPAASSPSAPAPAPPTGNPRAGGDVAPVIPGWKVVVNPKYGTAFDVPADWKVDGSGMTYGITDDSKNDGSPLISMSAPAEYKGEWCKVDSDKNGKEESTALATTGTKGGQGAKDTAEAAYNEAGNWVFAAYAQKAPKGTTKVVAAKEYTTLSGLKGHMATASVTGLPKKNKCDTDGKSIAFSFKTTNGDFSSWVLYGPANVPDEVKPEVYEKILSSVRLTTG
ncbi:hypothetical protein OHS33_05715 [Streptomyces sp. NBC_00536]|uniref:hypothetical protein n=1 Tax=Streptomyces sp. NBC_00536 TaxID=2975769 RepID=UPI002E817FA9|nr:hypothetical protein [Streptomyces sp. NBC_00536]WUC77882.1 hypothetical protein OHS33_05715 [Streptomyces sp. NBC_00536]